MITHFTIGFLLGGGGAWIVMWMKYNLRRRGSNSFQEYWDTFD